MTFSSWALFDPKRTTKAICLTLSYINLFTMALVRQERVFGAVVVAAVAYALFSRTAAQIIEGSVPIAIFLAAVSYGYFFTRWSFSGPPKMRRYLVLVPFVYLPIMLAAATIIYYGIWVGLLDSYSWLERQSPPRDFFMALIGVSVVVVGYALFLFRLHARFFFGVSEALVGLLIALRNVSTNADPASWGSEIFVLMLTASIFLIVRGFDNMHTGLRPESRDSILCGLDESEYGALWRTLHAKSRDGG